MWGAQVRDLADLLGVELDEVRERHETWVADEPIDCTMMRVEPGKVAAIRFAVEGIRDGAPVITMEHVNRLTEAAAPDWLFPPEGPGAQGQGRRGSGRRDQRSRRDRRRRPQPGRRDRHGGPRGEHDQCGVRGARGIVAARDVAPSDHVPGLYVVTNGSARAEWLLAGERAAARRPAQARARTGAVRH